MKIVVGTKNPIKLKAVENAINKIFPGAEFLLEGVSVSSGVSDQPMGDRETIAGAVNRAKSCLSQAKADFGIGLEGGVTEVEGKMFLVGWVAVVNCEGKIGLASAGRIELPEKIVQELKKGERELGSIVDEVCGQTNVKHGLGTNGILTKGLTNRTIGFENTTIEAMAKFISPEYY